LRRCDPEGFGFHVHLAESQEDEWDSFVIGSINDAGNGFMIITFWETRTIVAHGGAC
jgi:hypothetical protein